MNERIRKLKDTGSRVAMMKLRHRSLLTHGGETYADPAITSDHTYLAILSGNTAHVVNATWLRSSFQLISLYLIHPASSPSEQRHRPRYMDIPISGQIPR